MHKKETARRSLYIEETEMKQNVTYILECSDKTLYTGWTNDMDKRLESHNSGQGAKYTRGRTPVKLVYLEVHETKQEAMQREAYIKKLSRKEKASLIQQFTSTASLPQSSTSL